MQPPTEPIATPSALNRAPHGDEDALYRRHHDELLRAVSHVVRAPRELIEDACQTAWMRLLREQPDRRIVFGWLRTVAIREAYWLSRLSRRDARLELLRSGEFDWADTVADVRSLDDAVEALEALRALASLPDRQRQDLALKTAGYSYKEIRSRVPGRSFRSVSKSLARARRRIRQARADISG
jgi:DNA-directed RNA polymerase specialized sigma24 family protein